MKKHTRARKIGIDTLARDKVPYSHPTKETIFIVTGLVWLQEAHGDTVRGSRQSSQGGAVARCRRRELPPRAGKTSGRVWVAQEGL